MWRVLCWLVRLQVHILTEEAENDKTKTLVFFGQQTQRSLQSRACMRIKLLDANAPVA